MASLMLSGIALRETLFQSLQISTDVKIFLWIFFGYLFCWTLRMTIRANSTGFKAKTERSATPGDTHFPDDPISDESEDLLGRGGFIDGLFRQVSNYPSSDSFVFGLYGRWGEGKTSVLNLLKKRLIQEDNEIIFEFDPWNYSSEEALVKAYYTGLYQVFNERYCLPNFKRLLDKYQKTLSAGLKFSGVNPEILSGFSRDESLNGLRDEINDLIMSTGKKVIALIDDIDRLQEKTELLQVFKLAKLSARFKNTIFILSFDPLLVNEFLKDESSSDSKFLDKIVQAPIHLPAIDQANINKFLYYSIPDENHLSGIDRLFQSLKIGSERIKIFEGEFNYIFQTHVEKYFTTLRDAKRYLNRLYQNLPSIVNEINLADFLILELIGVFYPKVYADIWTNPWYYMPAWGDNMYSSPFVLEDKKIRDEKIKKHLRKFLDNEPRSDSLGAFLSLLFFQVDKSLGGFSSSQRSSDYETTLLEQRITNPEVFPKYFMLKTPSSGIPDETIKTIISIWNSLEFSACELRFLENFKKFQEAKRAAKYLEKLLNSVARFSVVTAKAAVSAIYKNINHFPYLRGAAFFDSEFSKAKNLMLRLINEQVPIGDIEEILRKIVTETTSFRFAICVVSSCAEVKNNSLYRISENTNIEVLKQYLSARLSQFFIEENRDVFEEEEPESSLFILAQWGAYSLEDKEKVNGYVFSLIENNAQYIGRIIKGYMQLDQIRYDDLIELYDENKLYEEIKRDYENSFSDSAEKQAIDLFLTVYEEKRASLGNQE